jgi:hypothetical protein
VLRRFPALESGVQYESGRALPHSKNWRQSGTFEFELGARSESDRALQREFDGSAELRPTGTPSSTDGFAPAEAV